MTEQPVVAPLPLQGTLPQNGHRNEGERKVITSLNPATNAVLGEVNCATPEEIAEAMQRAPTAQPAWGALPLEKRIDFLRALKKSMYTHHESLIEILTSEAGKIVHESRMEMMAVMSLADYYIRHSKKILKSHADFVLLTQKTFPTSYEIYQHIKSTAVEKGLQVHGSILWTGIIELNKSDEKEFVFKEE